MIGEDVAAFCDELIKDSPTYADRYQESLKDKGGKQPESGVKPG